MIPEKIFLRGSGKRPLVVLIHGMGVDMRIWHAPAEVRVLGGMFPLGRLAPGAFDIRNSLFAHLRDQGFDILLWSQSRPAGPVALAVNELATLLEEYRHEAAKGIILIGHSRGGLIGRLYLAKGDPVVKGIVSIAAPLHGTTLASWSVHIAPVASALHKVLAVKEPRRMKTAMARIDQFLHSEGIKELAPDSGLFSDLQDRREGRIRRISVGGTEPDLVRIGNVSLPDVFSRLLPDRVMPEELKKGFGDGLVSARSAVYPDGDIHYDFPCNHVSLLFDASARRTVIDEVLKISDH